MRASSVMRKRVAAAIAVASLGLLTFGIVGVATSRAQPAQTATFSQCMEEFAKDIKTFTDKRGGALAKIDSFVEDDSSEGSKGVSGGKIQIALQTALTKTGCKINKEGQWAVRGRYACDVENERARFSITAEIVTNTDQPQVQTSVLLKKTMDVKALDEIIELKGDVNFDATPKKPAEGAEPMPEVAGTAEREKAAANAIESPSVDLRTNVANQPTIVAPREESKFSIEVCRIQDGRPAPYPAQLLKSEDGTSALVHVSQNDKFGIRIRNGAPHGVGVRVLIDGVSMFQFSKTYEKTAATQLLYIDRERTAFIPGWHVTNEASMEFTIVDLPESVYASLLETQRRPDRLGTITVEFFPAWEPGQQRPVASKGSTDNTVAAGAGALINVPYDTKPVEFDVYPIAAVSVRYQLPPVELKAVSPSPPPGPPPADLPPDSGLPAPQKPGK